MVGLQGGRVIVQGRPEEVITTESIRALYGIELPVFRAEGRLCVMAI